MTIVNARDRAKVGEVFWVVVEHFYTPKDSYLCEKEYCVCKTEVYKLLPRWDEMVLHGPGPDGYQQLPSMPLSSPRRTIGCGPT